MNRRQNHTFRGEGGKIGARQPSVHRKPRHWKGDIYIPQKSIEVEHHVDFSAAGGVVVVVVSTSAPLEKNSRILMAEYLLGAPLNSLKVFLRRKIMDRFTLLF